MTPRLGGARENSYEMPWRGWGGHSNSCSRDRAKLLGTDCPSLSYPGLSLHQQVFPVLQFEEAGVGLSSLDGVLVPLSGNLSQSSVWQQHRKLPDLLLDKLQGQEKSLKNPRRKYTFCALLPCRFASQWHSAFFCS